MGSADPQTTNYMRTERQLIKRSTINSLCRGLGPVLVLMIVNAATAATYNTGTERINRTQSGSGFSWDVHYLRGFDGMSVYKDVQIDFDFSLSAYTTVTLQTQYRNDTKAGIESMFNNKFGVKDMDTGQVFPFKVEVTYDGPPDQTVHIMTHPGSSINDSNYNMTHWIADQTDDIVSRAHEFGHMIGLWDEYSGGALNPNDPIISANGLMGSGTLNGGINVQMYPRYYNQFADYVTGLNPDPTWVVVYVPEPSSFVLLIVFGPGILALARRRKMDSRTPPPITSIAASN